MPWKRRTPTWPLLLAVGCLFVLTLTAPAWWSRRRVERRAAMSRRDAAAAAALPAEAAPALPPLAGGPEMLEPELAEPQVAAPALAGAVVESDDYVVVAEPLVSSPPTFDVVTPTPDEPPATSDAAPSAAAESFAARPGDRSVLVRSIPAPALSAPPAITMEHLIAARDALAAMAARAHARLAELEQAAAAAAPAPLSSRVVVHSPSDRLAMIPELAEPSPTLRERALLESIKADAAAQPELAPPPPPAPPALAHRPVALLRELEALAACAPAAEWAARVSAGVEQLTTPAAPADKDLTPVVDELAQLAAAGMVQAATIRDPAVQSAWTRAACALDRRLPLWSVLVDRRAMRELVTFASPVTTDATLVQSLHQAAALTAGSTEGAAWRAYLRLDDLAGLSSVGGGDYAEARRAVARDVLRRLADPRLSPEQRAFLAEPPLAALADDLRPWAAGAVSLDALAALVEDYEFTGSLGDAAAIAELRLRMAWSGDPRLAVLADDINRHYRNANLRVALAAELFNRLVPPQQPTVVPVNDSIAGTEVRGRSRTETDVHIRLLPDPAQWKFGLDVVGRVQSRTYSDVGPARVRNSSRMDYQARKVITLDRAGLHVLPAEADVHGRNTLVGVETRLDGVPVVGPLIEDVVRKRHRENQAAAIAQVKAKVSRQACTRIDRESETKLEALEARFGENILAPLAQFALAAEPLDMSTTEERAVMRLRLASDQHLAAHTPRPSAPADSLASLQLHESAVNNAIRGLGLDGRRITVGELHALLRSKFAKRPEAPPADLPQRAIVEFARHDAVRVACHSDCVELTLNIVELRKGRDSIRNVGVHAFFRPLVEGLELKLVRDGTLQFEGSHLRTGPRLVLHSVFGKLLRKDQEIPLLASRLSDDPRLAGLMVTQLVIDDGWLALSVGPAHPDRVAWRTRGAVSR